LPDPIRRARRGAVAAFVVAHVLLAAVINLGLFAGGALRPLASATGGLFTGSLVANWLFIGCLVLIVILGIGRLRLYDVGLMPRHIPPAFTFALALWGAAQVIHLVAGLLTRGTIALNPLWTTVGVGFLIGLLVAQVLGNALFEEIAYRGFLFPQSFLKLTRWREFHARRLIIALIISQGIFALVHIPNRLYLGLSAGDILVDLLMLLGWGILFALIYMRTDNLFIAVAVHALGNAPTTLFATSPMLDGAGASLLIYVLAALGIFVLPVVRSRLSRGTMRDDQPEELMELMAD
jgi:hypothetical protein